MRARSLVFPLAAALLLAAGCGSDAPTGTTPPDEGAFDASVDGVVSARFTGDGRFSVFETPRFGGTVPGGHFLLFASDVDAQRRRGQSFDLMRPSGEIPAVGRYRIEPFTPGSFSAGSFEARYSFVQGDTSHVFVARAGEVHVTHSSRDRVEGHFRFSGARICLIARDQALPVCRWPVAPWEPQPDLDALPPVEVTGTFAAVPARPVPGFGG